MNVGVLVGVKALSINGLTPQHGFGLDVSTDCPELDKMSLGHRTFHYIPKINKVTDIRGESSELFGFVRVPTTERALVDCILYPQVIREDIFLEGMFDYIHRYGNQLSIDEKMDRLSSVAEKYGISRATLEYWADEAVDYMRM